MIAVVQPEFVEFIPDVLEDGKVYISQTYATAVHKCCCGCGQKVVTPLSANGWKLTVDGERVSLYPSIGNWSFPCRSHYWIIRNAVDWSYDMPQWKIDAARRREAEIRARSFDPLTVPGQADALPAPVESTGRQARDGFWAWLKKWFIG